MVIDDGNDTFAENGRHLFRLHVVVDQSHTKPCSGLPGLCGRGVGLVEVEQVGRSTVIIKSKPSMAEKKACVSTQPEIAARKRCHGHPQCTTAEGLPSRHCQCRHEGVEIAGFVADDHDSSQAVCRTGTI